jgi:uncharacterized membrane protein YdbT with pleckstrin-like domain
MNTFQSTYPLSSRKFWKKFLPSVLPIALFSALAGAFLGILLPRLFPTSLYPLHQGVEALMSAMILSGGILFVLLLMVYAWYYKTYIRLYFYEGEENFLTIKKGVFAPREIHVQYQKVQDVYVDQDILDRIMGLYDVHIASATVASGVEAHIDGVDAVTAEGLKNFILAKVQGASVSTVPAGGISSPSPVSFSSTISSDVYPIRGSWIWLQFVKITITSLFMSAFLTLGIAAKAEKGDFTFSFPLFFAVAILWFVLMFVGQVIWKRNYHFTFLPEYIQFNTGILSKSEQHLPYKSIQDVTLIRSFFERIFGLSTVFIENAAQMVIGNKAVPGGIRLVGLAPTDAEKIVDELKKTVLTKNSSGLGI